MIAIAFGYTWYTGTGHLSTYITILMFYYFILASASGFARALVENYKTNIL